MRIAHVITRLILGGAQENTLLTCEDLLRDYGDDVLLITGPPLGPEGSLLERARAGGVPLAIIAVAAPADPSLARCRELSCEIKRALRGFRPDVVHTHSAKGGMLGRAAACSLGVPAIVHTVHGAPFHPYQSRRAQGLVSRLRTLGRAALPRLGQRGRRDDRPDGRGRRRPAREVHHDLQRHGGRAVSRSRRSIASRVRDELGYTAEHVVIGKIARLFHLKGHEDVIRAAAAGRRARAATPGSSSSATACCRRGSSGKIAAAGLAEHFQFTGLVPPERIPELIAAMDIVVHASLREGLARVLPQALIAGKPVVSYDVDGAREVVLPGETGYLLPPGVRRRDGPGALGVGRRPGAATSAGDGGAAALHRGLPPRADDAADSRAV